jgi:small-conductance mechanosensitive channel
MLLNSTVVYTLFNLNILLLAITVLNRVIMILLRTPFMQGSNMIKNHTEEFERWSFNIIQVVGVLLLLRSILRLLGIWVNIQEWFNEFINETYQVGNSSIAIGGIITFILVIIVTIMVYRFIKALLVEEVFPRVKLPRGVPGAISMITGYVIVAFGFFLALGSVADLSSFGLLAGALGVGIGFGLQGIVANFIAGIVLAFERPIQVGDEIELTQTMGIVTSIGVRSTTIRTYDGSEVIVPNSDLITKDVINWTLTDRRKRRDINIGVAYGTDPDVVLDLIKRVSAEHPNVQNIPAPWALFDGFGDSSLNFRVRIWTTMDTGMTTKSEVTVMIYDALREAGIEIPFPQRDLHIKSLGEDVRKEIDKKPTPKTSGTRQTRTRKKDIEGPDGQKESKA